MPSGSLCAEAGGDNDMACLTLRWKMIRDYSEQHFPFQRSLPDKTAAFSSQAIVFLVLRTSDDLRLSLGMERIWRSVRGLSP